VVGLFEHEDGRIGNSEGVPPFNCCTWHWASLDEAKQFIKAALGLYRPEVPGTLRSEAMERLRHGRF
jgi:hypothetical protein